MSRRNWYLLTNSVVLGWVVLTIVAVTIHRFVPQPLWLMIHVPLLGAVTAAILVWSQHFSDTLLRRPAPAGRAGLAVRLGLHTIGAAVVITGILSGVAMLVVVVAVIVGAAILTHGVILTLQLRRALPARFSPLVRYYVAAAAVFLGGIAIEQRARPAAGRAMLDLAADESLLGEHADVVAQRVGVQPGLRGEVSEREARLLHDERDDLQAAGLGQAAVGVHPTGHASIIRRVSPGGRAGAGAPPRRSLGG